MRNRHATRSGVSSVSVPLMRSKSSTGSKGQDRSARTNSGIFAPSWFNSWTIAGCGEFRTRRSDRSGDIDPETTSGAEEPRAAPVWKARQVLGGKLDKGSTHTCKGETQMLRKMIFIIAAITAISGAVALSSTEASARWGGRGWGGGHFAFGSVGVGRVGGWGWRGAGWRGAGWGWRGP